MLFLGIIKKIMRDMCKSLLIKTSKEFATKAHDKIQCSNWHQAGRQGLSYFVAWEAMLQLKPKFQVLLVSYVYLFFLDWCSSPLT